jgi:hypothetical protein
MAALPVSVGRAPPVGLGVPKPAPTLHNSPHARVFSPARDLPLPRRGSENLSAGTGKIVKR